MSSQGLESSPSEQRARRRLPEALVKAALANPRWVLGAWIIALVLASVGVLGLEVDTSTDSILDRTAPAYQFHRESQDLFGGEEILVAAVEGDAPWDPAMLREVRRLSDRLEGVEGVRRVDSLATVPLIRLDDHENLLLDAPLGRGVPDSETDLSALVSQVALDRIAPGSLVSRDGRVFGINLLIEADTKGRFLEIVEEVRSVIDPAYTRLSGVPVFRTEINTRTEREILVFVPVTVLIMVLLLLAIFRSGKALLIPLSCGCVGGWIMLGAMGAAGVSISLLSMTLPTITLALGTAYSMHVLAAATRAETSEELSLVMARLSLPLTLSGLTTAIGFLSISAVRIDAVQEVGLFGAIGVLAVTLFTLTAVPTMLNPSTTASTKPTGAEWMEQSLAPRIVEHVRRHRWAVLGGWLAVIAVLGVGALKLEVQTDATNWFPKGTTVRDDYDRIRAQLSGISPVNIVISADPPHQVTDPEILAAVDGLAAYLEALPEVGKAISLADPLRQIHGAFLTDPAQPLPASRQMSEQYLLLLESVDQIDDLVTADRSKANVLLRVDDNQSGALLGVARAAEDWWSVHGSSHASARGTGTMFEFSRAEDEMSYGQLRGLSIALGAILILLLLVFRSAKLAVVALVPNAVPILAAFGGLGLLGIPLDAGTVIVGSLALGIAVDDTMHLLSGFQEALEEGADRRSAMLQSMSLNLPAITYTSLAVGLGFCVLALSDFTFIRNFGGIIAAVMAACWLCDVHLLPALILGSDGEPPVD